MYAGVDGCPKGWVAFVLPDERIVEGFQQLAGLLEALNGCEVIAVDMPLNAPETGQRPCDLSVRAELGPFASSLFMTPTAQALAAATQEEASRINIERGGYGVTSQAFSLRNKIAEVAELQRPDLVEVHPELVFRLLGPVIHRKRSWAGLRERVEVLQTHGLHPQSWDCGNWAEADDTMDAAAAALTARRYARGEALRFPPEGQDPAIFA
ncbi:MAG: DUF429 domain-containing protein [Candidatus Nanopelagicales bacterium]